LSFLGSLFGTDDAEKAARRAAAANRVEANKAYSDAQDILSPYYDAGTAAYGSLNDYLGVNGQGAQQTAMNNYVQSPDVAFRAGEGIKALDNSYAARSGGTDSGGLRKAQIKFGTGLATEDYGNFLQRLLASAGIGSQAASNLTNARYGSAGITTNANTNEGNAIANANLAEGSILGSIINGGLKLAGATGWNPFGK
jgi:hypothetical protein